MNRFPQRSTSHFDSTKKILTDRSEPHSHTSRNQSNNILDSLPHKNNSQIFTKDYNKSNQSKVTNRKKSISSYYFRDFQKPNQKNQQIFRNYLKKQNPNDFKKKRCQTTFDFTTNKTQNSLQSEGQISIIKIEPQKLQLSKSHYFCINHPEKIAYFEEQNSSKCYCHECSIENVKKNKRIIELTPSITEVKQLISKKIIQTQSYGQQLCQFIQKTIEKNIQYLDSTYKQLKMLFTSKKSQKVISSQSFDFQLKEIDLNFVKNLINIQQTLAFHPLNFLSQKTKTYKIINDIKIQEQKYCKTQKSVSQIFYAFPIQKSSIEKLSQKNQLKSQHQLLPSKNLIKEIEKALNYQSRNCKLKIKKVNLNLQPIKENKQNMNPNIIVNQRVSCNELNMKKGSF